MESLFLHFCRCFCHQRSWYSWQLIRAPVIRTPLHLWLPPTRRGGWPGRVTITKKKGSVPRLCSFFQNFVLWKYLFQIFLTKWVVECVCVCASVCMPIYNICISIHTYIHTYTTIWMMINADYCFVGKYLPDKSTLTICVIFYFIYKLWNL